MALLLVSSSRVLLYGCNDVFMYPLASYVECCLALIVPYAWISTAFQQQPDNAGVRAGFFFLGASARLPEKFKSVELVMFWIYKYSWHPPVSRLPAMELRFPNAHLHPRSPRGATLHACRSQARQKQPYDWLYIPQHNHMSENKFFITVLHENHPEKSCHQRPAFQLRACLETSSFQQSRRPSSPGRPYSPPCTRGHPLSRTAKHL